MSDYSEKTDLEINAAVYQKLYGVSNQTRIVPDYCNDWGEAGPIIRQESIQMIPPDEFYGEYEWEVSIKLAGVAYDENQLRAAMIVFLESA